MRRSIRTRLFTDLQSQRMTRISITAMKAWAAFIDLVRDSYLELAGRDRARGDNLVRRWVLSGQPLFRRLALLVLTEKSKDRHPLGEETRGFGPAPRRLGLGAPTGSAALPPVDRIESATQLTRGDRTGHSCGTEPKPRNPPPNYPVWIRREKALRLHKLADSGTRLDKRSRELAAELEPGEDADDERGEFARRQVEARRIGDEEFAPRDLLDGTAADVATAIRDESIGSDQFRGLARLQPGKAAEALELLWNEDRWPGKFWQHFVVVCPANPKGREVITLSSKRVAELLVQRSR